MIVGPFAAALAVGLFVAVPVVGTVAVGRTPIAGGAGPRLVIVVAAGFAICSVPLMASLILRLYSPAFLGALGWLFVCGWLVVRRPRMPPLPRLTGARVALGLGLIVVAVLYAAAPTDPLAGGRDMAVYTNHAIYMSHHGRLDIPYPDGINPASLPPGWVGYSGVYSTEPTLTVQFAHVYPAWLAQAFAAFGYGGLLRLNAILALMSLVGFFVLARRFIPEVIAALAALYLAFDAGQVWVVRNTLTEPMAQLFAVTGFLLLTAQRPVRPRAAAIWAGVAIGMTALVRLDSLVLLPLLIVGHTVASVFDRTAHAIGHATTFFAAAVPVFALAVAYYAAFSTPYLAEHLPLVLPIGIATMVAVVLFAASRLGAVRAAAMSVLPATPTLIAASVSILALAGYAYALRPRIEPFDILPIDTPSPLRSHVEDAMRNLGAYLTPVVLWMAIVAWVLGMAVAVRRRMTAVLPALITLGGFSAMYFWNQSITPDHFWAIRRFTPIIMPGAILLAACLGWVIVSRLPPRWRAFSIGLAAVALAGQSYRIGTPMYSTAERSGVYAAIEQFAAEIPEDETLIGPLTLADVHQVGTALFMSFDKPVLPLAYDEDGGRDELLAHLRGASSDRPVLALASGDRIAWLEGEVVASVNHDYEIMRPTTEPVPNAVADRSLTLALVRVTGLNTLDAELGPSHHWLVRETGFYNTEAGGTARWTNGNAVLHVPLPDDGRAEQLEVGLLWTGPSGATIQIFYNDHLLFDGFVPSGAWEEAFRVPDVVEPGGEAEIRLQSTTFVPTDVMQGSLDERTLGIMVRSLRLLSVSE